MGRGRQCIGMDRQADREREIERGGRASERKGLEEHMMESTIVDSSLFSSLTSPTTGCSTPAVCSISASLCTHASTCLARLCRLPPLLAQQLCRLWHLHGGSYPLTRYVTPTPSSPRTLMRCLTLVKCWSTSTLRKRLGREGLD